MGRSPRFTRLVGICVLLAIGWPNLGCESERNAQSEAERFAELESKCKRIADQTSVLLRYRCYAVELEMKKVARSLDVRQHLWNDINAQKRWILVGSRTYQELTQGQQLSSITDGWGLVFEGELASYTVTVRDKHIVPEYAWRNSDGEENSLTEEEFALVKPLFVNRPGRMVEADFGEVITYTHLAEDFRGRIVNVAPAYRYFAVVKIRNSTITLDPKKHLRNASLQHEITLGITKEVYESKDNIFDTRLSSSAFFKGKLSSLSGTIQKRWKEEATDYVTATLDNGVELVLPRARVE